MKSGILLSKAKLQWINEVVFSKEIVNSVVHKLLLVDSLKSPVRSLFYIYRNNHG